MTQPSNHSPKAPHYRRWWWESWLFTRPLFFLSVVVALPLPVVLVTTHRVNVAIGRRQALQHLSVTAQLAARIVDETFTDAARFAHTLAAQPSFHDALRQRARAQLVQWLQQLLPLVSKVNRVIVATAQGEILAVFPPASDLIGQSLAQDEGFHGAQEGGWHPYVSAVHMEAEGSFEKVVEVVVPVEEDHAVLGVIQVQYRVEDVHSWLTKISVEPDGFLYVVDHHDQLVVYPFQVLPGTPKVVSDWLPVAEPLSATGSTLIFRGGQHAQRWLAAVSAVGLTGWRVVAVQPERAVLRLLHQILWPTGMLVGSLLALVFFLSVELVRWRQMVSEHRGRSSASSE